MGSPHNRMTPSRSTAWSCCAATGPEPITTRQEVAVLCELLGTPLTFEELSFDDAMASFPDGTPDLVRRSLLETLGEAASSLVVTDHRRRAPHRAPRPQLPGLGFCTPRGIRPPGEDKLAMKPTVVVTRAAAVMTVPAWKSLVVEGLPRVQRRSSSWSSRSRKPPCGTPWRAHRDHR